MPFINQAILISGQWLKGTAHDLPSWDSQILDTDMAFAAWMRERVHTHTHTHTHTQRLFCMYVGLMNYRVTSCMLVISMTTDIY